MPIRNLPFQLQPREKAFINGISVLNDAELIALFLRTGYKDLSVVGLANLLLARFNNLNQLARATFHEIKKIKGIGSTKAIEIVGLFEIAKRINNRSLVVVQNCNDAINIARQLVPNFFQEHFVIIVLSHNKQIVYQTKLVSGREDSLEISPRLVLAEILKRNGSSFYCFHNHPSGKTTPSSEDITMTETLAYYCDLFGIKLLGHYILTEKAHQRIVIDNKI